MYMEAEIMRKVLMTVVMYQSQQRDQRGQRIVTSQSQEDRFY